MGVSRSVYVGVFIVAPHYKVKTERKVFRKPSGKVAKTRFNPETGEEYKPDVIVENVWETTHPYITDNDKLDECKFFMPAYTEWWQNASIFVGNDDRFGLTYNNIHTVVFDDYESPEATISAFTDEYKEYLDYYKKKFPESEIEVKYGVVIYEH